MKHADSRPPKRSSGLVVFPWHEDDSAEIVPQQASSSPLFFSSIRTRLTSSLHRRIGRSSISTLPRFLENVTAQISVNMGDRNVHSGNTIGSFNKSIYKSAEDAHIRRWLSPLEPNNRHRGVRTERFDGIGDWVLETKKFREWRSSGGGADNAILFCSGNPGVGKTYLRQGAEFFEKANSTNGHKI